VRRGLPARLRIWWGYHDPARRWRGRASKWHPGLPHHEVTCTYEEAIAVLSRRELASMLAEVRLPEWVLSRYQQYPNRRGVKCPSQSRQ
jgi:hypothetical protein